MRYQTTCRWNGIDVNRVVEIAPEHVHAYQGDIDAGYIVCLEPYEPEPYQPPSDEPEAQDEPVEPEPVEPA